MTTTVAHVGSLAWELSHASGGQKEKKPPSIGSQGPKTMSTHRPALRQPRTGDMGMHRQTSAKTRMYGETRLKTQRQLTAVGIECHSHVLIHTCSTEANAHMSVQVKHGYLHLPKETHLLAHGYPAPSRRMRLRAHRAPVRVHGYTHHSPLCMPDPGTSCGVPCSQPSQNVHSCDCRGHKM